MHPARIVRSKTPCVLFLSTGQKSDLGTKGATAAKHWGRIIMLENTKAFSGFAAPDIAKEKKFYSQTLGLKTVEGQWPAHIASGRRQ